MTAQPLTLTDLSDAPWPDVPECHGHGRAGDLPACRQCDGSHVHVWVAWHQASQVGTRTSLVGSTSGPGLPVRCTDCGARKCDDPVCAERRHHRGPHLGYSDTVRPIGSSS